AHDPHDLAGTPVLLAPQQALQRPLDAVVVERLREPLDDAGEAPAAALHVVADARVEALARIVGRVAGHQLVVGVQRGALRLVEVGRGHGAQYPLKERGIAPTTWSDGGWAPYLLRHDQRAGRAGAPGAGRGRGRAAARRGGLRTTARLPGGSR